MIDLNCPVCDTTLELTDNYQGEEVNCPECQELFGVPYLPDSKDAVKMAVINPADVIPQNVKYNSNNNQPINPQAPIMITDKSGMTIDVACWTIFAITFVLIAVPYFPTFWLWIPLALAGLICTVIAFAKAKYVTGIFGIMWSLMGIPAWWFISGILTVGLFSSASAVVLDDAEAENEIAMEQAAVDDDNDLLFDTELVKPDLRIPKNTPAPKWETYVHLIEIKEFKTKYIKTYSNDKLAAVQMRLKNLGQKTIKSLQITVYFLDDNGTAIFEDTMYPVNGRSYFSGDKPLKSGYVTSMGDKWSTFEKCPPEWKEGSVRYKITNIEFTEER